MPAKQMVFSQSARTRIAYGLDVLANTVKVTLGPRGRNVIRQHGRADGQGGGIQDLRRRR